MAVYSVASELDFHLPQMTFDFNLTLIWFFRKISRSDSISIQSIQYSIESLKDEIKLLKVNEDDDFSQATSQQFSNSMTSDVLQIGIGSFRQVEVNSVIPESWLQTELDCLVD